MVFKVRNFQRILSADIKCVGESLSKTPKEPASVVESDGKSHKSLGEEPTTAQ